MGAKAQAGGARTSLSGLLSCHEALVCAGRRVPAVATETVCLLRSEDVHVC